MWIPKEIRTSPHILDFSSSDQGMCDVQQLFVDGELFANAIGLTDWDDPDRFQVLVCEECGFEHCEPGGWLMARRSGDNVALLPCVNDMNDADDVQEYGPPQYLYRRGSLLFGFSTYDAFRRAGADLPSVTDLKPLVGSEALRWLQWLAPGGGLGRIGDATDLTPSDFLACSTGQLDDQLSLLKTVIRSLDKKQPIQLHDIGTGTEPIVFFLDDGSETPWPAMVDIDGRMHLQISPGYVLGF